MSCVSRILKEFEFLDKQTADRLVKQLEEFQAQKVESNASYGYLRK